MPGLSRSVPVGGKPTGEFTDISTRLASESCTDPLLGNDSGITRMSEGRSGCKGPPTLGYFHQDCWNNLGFSYILAACLNRSLVREIDDRFWPKPPNAVSHWGDGASYWNPTRCQPNHPTKIGGPGHFFDESRDARPLPDWLITPRPEKRSGKNKVYRSLVAFQAVSECRPSSL